MQRAGGSVGQFSVSLSWSRSTRKYADLDLHLYLPAKYSDPAKRDHSVGDVCFRNKLRHYFELDVDMCAGASDTCPHKPVENIVFPQPSLSKRKRRRKRIAPGKYTIVVQNWGYKTVDPPSIGDKGPAIPFDVLFSMNGNKTLITGLCIKPNRSKKASAIRVFRIVIGPDGSVMSMKKHKPMGDICRYGYF